VPITPTYTKTFVAYLDKHRSVEKAVRKKIEAILLHSLAGEPLKHDLAGLRSAPVRRNFILIYAYCKDCRARNCEPQNNCPDCRDINDETVIFHIIAPHDKAYQQMTKKR
jgi:hypothetical protein